MVREQPARLSQLIDVFNERFGTDFNQADQLFFDQIVETAIVLEPVIAESLEVVSLGPPSQG